MKDGTPASTWAKSTPGGRRSSHKDAEVGNIQNSIINDPHDHTEAARWRQRLLSTQNTQVEYAFN